MAEKDNKMASIGIEKKCYSDGNCFKAPYFGVIFDVDGVLVDSKKVHFESILIVGKTVYNLPEFTWEDFGPVFGLTLKAALERLWPQQKWTSSLLAGFKEHKDREFQTLVKGKIPEMSGARVFVERLIAAEKFVLAIGSSGERKNVQRVKDHFESVISRPPGNINNVFESFVSGGDVSNGKPAPEVFLKAAEFLNLHPSKCAVIEDAVVGIQAAVSAGAAAIGLTSSCSRDQLIDAGADFVVDSLTEDGFGCEKIIEIIVKNREKYGNR